MYKLLLTLFVFTSVLTFGQQMPQFSQYHRNQYMINPAAAGIYDFVDVTLGGRLQWAGFDNAPMSSYLYVSSPLSKTKQRYNPALRISNGPIRNPEVKTGKLKHALGGQVIADQYGAFRQLKGALTYALHLPVATDYNLSFGVNVGVSNWAFMSDRAQTLNVMNPSLGYTDNTYNTYAEGSNMNTLDLGAGLHFYSQKLYVGISASRLTQDFVRFGNGSANFNPNMHYMLMAGYKFTLNDNLTLTPSILAKYMLPSPVTLEGGLQLEYKEWLWFTLAYRQGVGGFNNVDALIGMFGLNISRVFKVGYSFDYSISEFSNHSAGGHELVLGLMLGR